MCKEERKRDKKIERRRECDREPSAQNWKNTHSHGQRSEQKYSLYSAFQHIDFFALAAMAITLFI